MGPINDNIDAFLDGLMASKMSDEDKKVVIKDLLTVMLDLYENGMSRKCVNAYIEKKLLNRVAK